MENDYIEIERPHDAFKRMGISKSWGWKLIKDGILPKPFPLIPNGRAVGFRRSDIDSYILERISDANQQ